jgi:hypothetical protein
VFNDDKMYDVVVQRPKRYKDSPVVKRVWLVRQGERIEVGTIMKVDSFGAVNWWAMGYVDNKLVPSYGECPHNMQSVHGFALQRYAVEHILKRTGWMKDDKFVLDCNCEKINWSDWLRSFLDDKLEDGTPIYKAVFAREPALEKRLYKALGFGDG